MKLSLLTIATLTAAIFSFVRIYFLEVSSDDHIFGEAAFFFTIISLTDGITSIRQFDAAIQSNGEYSVLRQTNRIIYQGLINGLIAILACFIMFQIWQTENIEAISFLCIFLFTFGKTQNAIYRLNEMFDCLALLIFLSSMLATVITIAYGYFSVLKFKTTFSVLVVLMLPHLIIGSWCVFVNLQRLAKLGYTENTKFLIKNYKSTEFNNLYFVSIIATVTERMPVLLSSYFGDMTLAGKIFFIRQLMSPVSTLTSVVSQYYQPKVARRYREGDISFLWLTLNRFLYVGLILAVIGVLCLLAAENIVHVYRSDLVDYYHYFYLFFIMYVLQFSSIPFYPLILQFKLLWQRNYFLMIILVTAVLGSVLFTNIIIYFLIYIIGSVAFRTYNYYQLSVRLR